MTFLQFSDKSVPYGVFVKDVAAEVVHLLKKDEADPEYISQRKAYEIFGRRNVERWRRQGKVSPCKRPGKLEYRTADLRLLQRTQQDYLDPTK
ncbi:MULTISPECIES: hypothetical protein [Bacteroidales]|uniref:hypothetical protein n=1 Tax=Bacteroidales TaxID=171549 RepID=UPI000FFE3841|nr:hypothetical protein [Bacteroides acidifaciens]RXE73392.1 hypothetical protein ED551_08915 [Muribaculaceae bacterium Isolate-013 (NCI)]